MMRSLLAKFALVQVAFVVLLVGAWKLAPAGVSPANLLGRRESLTSTPPIPRRTALVITPLYDEPSVVSEDELAMVLNKVAPRFPKSKLKPNHVEHALRTWTNKATFRDPAAMSGQDMQDFLVDHGRYLASWGDDIEPLLQDRSEGVHVRWGKDLCASVHHDHWLACLTEAGVSLDEPVFTPSNREHTIADVLNSALADFRVDEVETEWSTLAFALWMAPEHAWTNRQGRHITFDLLAERLMRGSQKYGVCSGTHRVYTLMALVRLDDEHHILSAETRAAAWKHLEFVRDQIRVCQFEDGHWPSNWAEGESALQKPIADELYKQVIATGHHLEWLAIAPLELHPPREQVLKAARWVIDTTAAQTQQQILERYTFFSHVGKALALWRKTSPVEFWSRWEAAHPDQAQLVEAPPTGAAPPVATPATEAH